MKIYSASNGSKFRIKWAESEYTGGNIDVVWGQLTNGNYFYASDFMYTAYIVNENPGEYHNGEYDGSQFGDDELWRSEHTVVELSEKEQLEFWLSLVKYCQNNNVPLSDNYDAYIQEIKECLEDYN